MTDKDMEDSAEIVVGIIQLLILFAFVAVVHWIWRLT